MISGFPFKAGCLTIMDICSWCLMSGVQSKILERYSSQYYFQNLVTHNLYPLILCALLQVMNMRLSIFNFAGFDFP